MPDNSPVTPLKRPSRLRAAWLALRGAPVVPDQMRAEWVAWQFEFETLLDKLSNVAARLYQREKRALDAAEKASVELAPADLELPTVQQGSMARKAHLYQRMRARQQAMNGAPHQQEEAAE